MKKLIAAVLTIALALSCAVIPPHTAYAVSDGDTYKDREEEYTYRDGYWERYNSMCDGYQYMCLMYDKDGKPDFSHGTAPIGEALYDKDGNLVYKEVDGKVLVDKRPIEELEVQCDEKDVPVPVVTAGFSVKFRCYTYGKDVTIKWSSSNPKVASVDKNGKVTGKSAGKATIIATVAETGQKATKNVKVVKNELRYDEKNRFGVLKVRFYYDENKTLICEVYQKITANMKKERKEYKWHMENAGLFANIKVGIFQSNPDRFLLGKLINITHKEKGDVIKKNYRLKKVKYMDLVENDGSVRADLYASWSDRKCWKDIYKAWTTE